MDNNTVICYTDAGEAVAIPRAALSFLPEVYGVAFTEDRDQVLLARDAGSELWELPNTTVAPGEPLIETMQRVFAEGFGLQAGAGEPISFGDSFLASDTGAKVGQHVLSLYYLVHVGGRLDPHKSGSADAAWVPIEELDSLAISDDTYDAIQHALHWLDMSEGPRPEPDDDDD